MFDSVLASNEMNVLLFATRLGRFTISQLAFQDFHENMLPNTKVLMVTYICIFHCRVCVCVSLIILLMVNF